MPNLLSWRALLRIVLACTALTLSLPGRPASAQQRDEAAKVAYAEGKSAYEAGHFEAALDAFRRSFTLSGAPALLYNISSTLQRLDRPGEAASALRDFVKARPDDPERADVEQRIASLDKAQELKQRELDRKEAREAEEARKQQRALERAATPPGALLTELAADHRLTLERERERRRRLGLGLGLGVGILAAGGIAAGIVCGLGHCSGGRTKDYDFGVGTVSP